jgi:hypothetical protein
MPVYSHSALKEAVVVSPIVYPAAAWIARKLVDYARSPAGREARRQVGQWFVTTPTGQQVTGAVVSRATGAGTHAVAEGMRRAGVPVPPVVEEAVATAASFGFIHHYEHNAGQNTGMTPGQAPSVSGVGGASGGTGSVDNVGNWKPPDPPPDPPPTRK